MITGYKLLSQFKPFYKAGKSFNVTADGFILADDGDNINYIDMDKLKLIKTLNNENEVVTCFVANPIDHTVIIANKDLQIRKIDRVHNEKRSKIWNSCHSAPIFAMCLNKSSTRLTTGSSDNKVRIWQMGENEGNSYSCIFHKSKITHLKNHPTRSMVVSVSMLEHDIASWDTEKGKLLGLFSGHMNEIKCVDFHEGSEMMVSTGQDKLLMVWDCVSFTRTYVIPMLESVQTCIVMRDSVSDNVRVMVGGESGIMKLINVSKKCISAEYKKASLFITDAKEQDGGGLRSIRTIAQTSTGDIIVVRESSNIEFYNENMSLKYELAGEMDSLIDTLVVGEKNNMVLAVESAPYMRLFDCGSMIEDGSECSQWPSHMIAGGHIAEITSAAVFDNGRHIVSGGKDGRVCVWNIDSSNPREKLKLVTSLVEEGSPVSAIYTDKEGSRIYVNYSKTEILAVLSYKNDILSKLCEVSKPHNGIVSCMDVNIDGSMLATGSKDKMAKIWSYSKKKKQLVNKGILKGHRRGIWSVKFSSIERILLTSSMDKTIKLWSLENFECISEFQSDFIIYKALFSQNEKQVLSCDSNGTVSIWNCDKRSVSVSVHVHDKATHALNAICDEEGNISGFVVAGESSMLALYKDVSKEQIEENKKMIQMQTEENQELNNLLAQEHFIEALKLAIKLNKQLQAYKILEKIQRMEGEVVSMTPLEMSEKTKMSEAFRTLDKDLLKTLLQFAIKWISNVKTFKIATQVFVFMLCTVPNKELMMNPDFVKHLQNIKAHAYKHYQRTKVALERVGLFDYVSEVAFVKKLETMDTD